ncbi:MAG: iron-sulfur cluster assembly scaffold protein [Azospirillaceae bacterium]
MSEPDSLYQKAILDHAKAAVGAGKLEAAQGRATVDNPICGDRVTVEVALGEDGRVTALGHTVRGCVLCAATASVLGADAPGHTPAELRAAAQAFDAMIREGAPTPEGWPGLDAFTPVHEAKSRHECVLLPFEALDKAMADAGEPAEPAA